MTGNRFIRRGVSTDLEPKLGRAFLISFVFHLVLLLVFSGVILPRFSSDRKPVYYVDLVNLPVARPQSGRPDASPKSSVKKKAAKKSTASVKKSSPVATSSKVVTRRSPSDADINAKIADMQAKKKNRQEIDDLKRKLAALAVQDSRGEDAVVDAPIGMPDGTGDEVGPSYLAWLQAYLKQQWALSEYQVSRLDLEAVVRIVYDDQGRMVDFTFLEKSGDHVFDDSVKTAILKSRELPKPPPVPRWEVDVVFNLKDLLD